MPAYDYLFLVRDTGDTDNLKEYAKVLIKQGRRVAILPLAVAAQNSLASEAELKTSIVTLDKIPGVKTQLGIKPEEFGGGKGHRVKFVDAGEAKIIADFFVVPLVITGVVARSQRNICAAFKEKQGDAPFIIGYYDSLTYNQGCFLFHRSFKFSAFEVARETEFVHTETKKDPFSAPFPLVLDELWVPLAAAQEKLTQATGNALEKVRVVNHPSSQVTANIYNQLLEKREAIRERLQVKGKVLFYAGGRDAAGSTLYTDSFKAFMGGIQQAGQGVTVIVGQHPASDAILERSFEPRIKVIKTVKQPKDTSEFTTEELVVAADIIVTWNSTVASQAAYLLGKPVCFVETRATPDLPFAVVAGFAKQATSAADFAKDLQQAMLQAPNTAQVDLAAFAKPTVAEVTDMLIERLKNTAKSDVQQQQAAVSSLKK